jgi:hypothetical protein
MALGISTPPMNATQPKIVYKPQEGFILAEELENTTLDNLFYEADEVMRLMKHHDCNKVLIDSTRVNKYPGLLKLVSFSKDISRRPEFINLRLAVVPNKMAVQIKFIMKLTQKRGFNFRVFSTVSEAKLALLK